MNYGSERAGQDTRRSIKPQDKLPVVKDSLLARIASLNDQLQNYMQQGKQYRSKSYGLAASAMELLLSGMGEEQLGKYSFL
jgi:hypothetical protein